MVELSMLCYCSGDAEGSIIHEFIFFFLSRLIHFQEIGRK